MVGLVTVMSVPVFLGGGNLAEAASKQFTALKCPPEKWN